jgi:hypothetical protein
MSFGDDEEKIAEWNKCQLLTKPRPESGLKSRLDEISARPAASRTLALNDRHSFKADIA